MKKRYILMHFSKFKRFLKVQGVKYINISLLPPPWWKLRMSPSNERMLYPDKEVFDKFKSGKITQLEFEMTYRYKLRELKQSGWLDDYIESLENCDDSIIAIMFSGHPTATVNVNVLAEFLKDNYGINFEVIPAESAITTL